MKHFLAKKNLGVLIFFGAIIFCWQGACTKKECTKKKEPIGKKGINC